MFCIPPPFTVWENIPALRFNHFFPAFLTPKHPSVRPGNKSDRPLSTGSRRETRDLGRESKSQRGRWPEKDGHTGEPQQHPHLSRGHTEVPVGPTQAVPCLDPSHKGGSAPGSSGRERQICMHRSSRAINAHLYPSSKPPHPATSAAREIVSSAATARASEFNIN